MSASFKASGFRDLDRKLAALAAALPEEKQREILHRAAEPIVAEAKRLAPVDTGLLRDSIRSEDDRDARVYGKLNAGGMATARVSPLTRPAGRRPSTSRRYSATRRTRPSPARQGRSAPAAA